MIEKPLQPGAGLFAGGTLLRRTSVVFSGVLGAKVVAVISLLVLARLYDADAFGLLGLVQALVYAGSVVATLSYSHAIPIPRKDRDGAALFWLALGLALTATALVGGILFTQREAFVQVVGVPALLSLIPWALALFFSLAVVEVLTYWFTRRRDFRGISLVVFSVAALAAAAQLGAWVLGEPERGLVVGVVAGTVAGGIIASVRLWREDGRLLRSGLSRSRLAKVARSHWRFPVYHAPASFAGGLSSAIVPLGLGVLFSPAVVGLYWMAERVGGALTTLVRQSLQQVLLGHAAEVRNEAGDLTSLFRRTTLALALVSLLPLLVFVVAGPTLFALVFGSQWTEAGVFARWLALAWCSTLVNIPAVQLATVLDRQRWILLYTLGLILFRAGGAVLAAVRSDPLLLIALHSMGTAAAGATLVAVTWFHLRKARG